MTEVSMPLVNHHPRQGTTTVVNEEGSDQQQQQMVRTGDTMSQVPPAANGEEQLGAAQAQEGGGGGGGGGGRGGVSGPLFVQAGGGGRLPAPAPTSAVSAATTIVQETLEEDQTIVIDLTEERCNLTRGKTSSTKSAATATATAATVTQWSSRGLGRPPPPLPRQFATSAVASAHDGMPNNSATAVDPLLSSTTSSLDVQLGQESGSHFLISRMLNGRYEEEGPATAGMFPNEDDIDGRGEILNITATVGGESAPRVPPLHPTTTSSSAGGGTLFPPLNQSSMDESDEDERNLSSSIPTERYVEPAAGKDKEPISDDLEEEGWTASLSSPAREPPPPINGAPHPADRRSRSLRRAGDGTPFNLFGSTSQSLSEVTPLPPARYSAISSSMHRLRSSDGYRSLDRRMVRGGANANAGGLMADGKSASVRARKSRSNDFLDRMDVSVSSSSVPATTTDGSRGRSRSKRKMPARMNKIEKGLYLGNMEAATDVILLESRGITHIVTLDSVPLPRKISSFLPRVSQLHLQVTDLPDEDLLSHVQRAVEFIRAGIDDAGGNVLVHCFRGKSRSAAVVLAYIMQKYRFSLEKALKKVKGKRECINPHDGFLAQLKLYEQMEYDLDPSNVQFKMFKLRLAAERMRKAKVLFRDSLDGVIDDDPGDGASTSSSSGSAGSGGTGGGIGSGVGHTLLYKCRRCRRTLATSHNLVPHVRGEAPDWRDPKWSLPAEEVLEGAADLGLDLCHPRSVFICPVGWMRAEVRQTLSGRLRCPNCQTPVGAYSWVAGVSCAGCKGVQVVPAFQLNVTEIIFKTKNKFLQAPSGREPVVV